MMENNELLRRYVSQFSGFQGNVFPKPKNIYRQPPIYVKSFECGKDTNKGTFSTAKVWLHEPNFQFPKHGVFFSLNNRNSAFVKLNSMQELRDLSQWLNSCITEMEERIPSLIEKELVVMKAVDEYNLALKAQEVATDGLS